MYSLAFCFFFAASFLELVRYRLKYSLKKRPLNTIFVYMDMYYIFSHKNKDWVVGCFGLNDSFRKYFRLYRAVSQGEEKRREKWQRREKKSKQPPTASTASAVGPCSTTIQISRTSRQWKFTQHHRTTRPTLPKRVIREK